MNDLIKIREEAKLKFELFRKEKDAAILKNTEEQELINSFILEINGYINKINETSASDMFQHLQYIQTKIIDIIELIVKHDRLPEIQGCIFTFVVVMNKTYENKKNDADYVSQIMTHVTKIFELCRVEIDIEMMDTSEDSDIALKLQDEMYNL